MAFNFFFHQNFEENAKSVVKDVPFILKIKVYGMIDLREITRILVDASGALFAYSFPEHIYLFVHQDKHLLQHDLGYDIDEQYFTSIVRDIVSGFALNRGENPAVWTFLFYVDDECNFFEYFAKYQYKCLDRYTKIQARNNLPVEHEFPNDEAYQKYGCVTKPNGIEMNCIIDQELEYENGFFSKLIHLRCDNDNLEEFSENSRESPDSEEYSRESGEFSEESRESGEFCEESRESGELSEDSREYSENEEIVVTKVQS